MRKAPTVKLDIPVRKELERLEPKPQCGGPVGGTISNCLAGRRGSGQSGDRLPSWTSLVKRPDVGAIVSLKMASGGIEKDASRSGRIPSIGRRKRARIVKKTVEGKPPNATHWSRSFDGGGQPASASPR